MSRKFREQFVFLSRSLEISICRWPLRNKDTADWNECSRVEVVNLMDGPMDGWMNGLTLSHIVNHLSKKAYRKRKKIPSYAATSCAYNDS